MRSQSPKKTMIAQFSHERGKGGDHHQVKVIGVKSMRRRGISTLINLQGVDPDRDLQSATNAEEGQDHQIERGEGGGHIHQIMRDRGGNHVPSLQRIEDVGQGVIEGGIEIQK